MMDAVSDDDIGRSSEVGDEREEEVVVVIVFPTDEVGGR